MLFSLLIKLFVLMYIMTFGTLLSAGSTKYFYNGTKLYNLCRAENAIDEALCEGYILGVQDAIYSGHLSDHFSICLPEGVEPDQIRLLLLMMDINLLVFYIRGLSTIKKTRLSLKIL